MSQDVDADPLLSIHEAQAALADRVSRGGWRYDLIYSVLSAALVAGWCFPVRIAIGVEAVSLLALGLLARIWANHTGVWFSGVKPPRARWAAIAVGVCIALLVIGNLQIMHGDLPFPAEARPFLPWGSGLAAFVLALCGSRLWRRIYRREMGLS